MKVAIIASYSANAGRYKKPVEVRDVFPFEEEIKKIRLEDVRL